MKSNFINIEDKMTLVSWNFVL